MDKAPAAPAAVCRGKDSFSTAPCYAIRVPEAGWGQALLDPLALQETLQAVFAAVKITGVDDGLPSTCCEPGGIGQQTLKSVPCAAGTDQRAWCIGRLRVALLQVHRPQRERRAYRLVVPHQPAWVAAAWPDDHPVIRHLWQPAVLGHKD
eukprot:450216-Pelagomonas_calceolata.AAC.4